MNAITAVARSTTSGRRAALALFAAGCLGAALVACGGSADAPPPPESGSVVPQAVPPNITLQPVDVSVTAGQPASFAVAASGTSPITYRWQRNGVDIAGATSTTYALMTTAVSDSGAVFHVIATNVAGSATSSDATLTVTVAAPVLTITQQPADASVTAGASASFTAGGTCSSGTLDFQWQRRANSDGTFSDIAGATGATYAFSTVTNDSGAQFRALLDCSGQSSTPSSIATLTVTAPSSVSLSLLPMVGLRTQAQISATVIDQESSGSFTFVTFSRIQRLSADLSTVTPVAGGNVSGSADGPAASASFNSPNGLTHDSAGNVYVADTNNQTIRRIGTDGNVTTLAGLAGSSGSADGTGSAARFTQPLAIAMGPDGDLYVADAGNFSIRRVTTAGVVTTYAGGTAGYADGPALGAQFRSLNAVATAANGDVLVADSGNARVRRILRSGNGAGTVETLAGNGTSYSQTPDGSGPLAIIDPVGLVVSGNTVTVSDANGLLRQIDLTSKDVSTMDGHYLPPGYADGTFSTAQLETGSTTGITTGPNGGFMLAENQRALRLVSAAGDVSTIATGLDATSAGTGVLAQLPFVFGGDSQAVTVDPSGNVVIADDHSKLVRRISPSGVVSLAAGLVGSFQGEVDGTGSAAQFARLGQSILSDSTGQLFVSDAASIRRISPTNVTTLLTGVRCCAAPAGSGAIDGSATVAQFNTVKGMALSPDGNLYVADSGNNAIRRVGRSGNVTTYAGVFGQGTRVDGPIATARFIAPSDLALAADGTLYVVDAGTIRTISADGATVASLSVGGTNVTHIVFDSAGTLYIGTSTQGLYSVAPGSSNAAFVIGGGDGQGGPGAVVLSPTPRLAGVDSMAVLGPKQLVILSGGLALVLTLP